MGMFCGDYISANSLCLDGKFVFNTNLFAFCKSASIHPAAEATPHALKCATGSIYWLLIITCSTQQLPDWTRSLPRKWFGSASTAFCAFGQFFTFLPMVQLQELGLKHHCIWDCILKDELSSELLFFPRWQTYFRGGEG